MIIQARIQTSRIYLGTPFYQILMGQEDSKLEKHGATGGHTDQDLAHGEVESIIEKRQTWGEKIADEMKQVGIDAEPIPPGSSEIEDGPVYSQMFTSSFRLVINRGIIKVRGKNFDYVQVLQRG